MATRRAARLLRTVGMTLRLRWALWGVLWLFLFRDFKKKREAQKARQEEKKQNTGRPPPPPSSPHPTSGALQCAGGVWRPGRGDEPVFAVPRGRHRIGPAAPPRLCWREAGGGRRPERSATGPAVLPPARNRPRPPLPRCLGRRQLDTPQRASPRQPPRALTQGLTPNRPGQAARDHPPPPLPPLPTHVPQTGGGHVGVASPTLSPPRGRLRRAQSIPA